MLDPQTLARNVRGGQEIPCISWRHLQFVAASTEPKGRVLKNVHLMAMDIGMLEHLFSDWSDLKHHRNLQEADERNHRNNLQELDKIREAEEQEHHEKIALEMEHIDHCEHNLDSVD
jgi:hypothetical protein